MNNQTSFTIIVVTITLSIAAYQFIPREQKTPVIMGTTWEERVERLEAKADQNDKDWTSFLNFNCLNIQHYADETQVMENWPFPEAGRCKKGFRN